MNHPFIQTETRFHLNCPVCSANDFEFLCPVWKNYHAEWDFSISETEWFVSCETCGTICRFPLVDYGAEFKKYGEDYYNVAAADNDVAEHAKVHFDNFQKPNYDSVREFLSGFLPAAAHPRWLDVGSIGYATTFPDYQFTTIEPDERIVALGRKLFGSLRNVLQPRIHSATIESFSTKTIFDGILFNNSFYCVTDPSSTLRKANELLKPNGHLVVTISTIFTDAVQNRDDGLVSRIEDALVGETLWVFYNQHALTYLAQQSGFSLVKAEEIEAYGKKTMMAYVFRKTDDNRPGDKNLIAASAEKMHDTLESVYQGFIEQTADTVSKINKPDYILVAPARILRELASYSKFDDTAGVLCADLPIEKVSISGIQLSSWDEIKAKIDSGKPRQYRVMICSFKNQEKYQRILSKTFGQPADIYLPNRRSGLESLTFDINGKVRPIKGLIFSDLPDQ